MATRGRKPNVNRARTRAPGDDALPVPYGQVVAIRRPRGLSPRAVKAWDALVPSLARSGALVPGDDLLLVELVEAISLAQEYRAAIEAGIKAEVTIEHSRGGTAYEVGFLGSALDKRLRGGYVAAIGVAERLASEYGVTPTSRARLGINRARAEGLLSIVGAAMSAEAAAEAAEAEEG